MLEYRYLMTFISSSAYKNLYNCIKEKDRFCTGFFEFAYFHKCVVSILHLLEKEVRNVMIYSTFV